MPYDFLGDVDMSKVVLTPMQMVDGKPRVEICRDGTSTGRNNKLIFNLCPDVEAPLEARYRLDAVRDDSDGSRRGLIVRVCDPDAVRALRALDDAIVAAALANCKEWFKKSAMSEEEVRFRYRPLLFKAQEEDDSLCTKFKVKCAKYPTKLHLDEGGGRVVMDGGRLHHLEERGAKVAPIVSIFGLWFMGGGSSFGVSMQAEEMVVVPGTAEPMLSNFLTKRPLEVVRDTVQESEPDAKRVRDEPVLEGAEE
jgi:hypothetical protein